MNNTFEYQASDLHECHAVGRDENHFMGNGKSGSARSTRERLVMDFEPESA